LNTELPFFSQVFWIHPNEYLFNCLPDRISEELRLEYNAILKGATSTQSNCNYFEVCQSTLDVDDMKIYPNPANQAINVDFSLPAATVGYISLVNISGAQVKVLVSDTNFQEGANHFTANISDINPGIYLVMIKTENGFKTQRLIVSR
jgi:hypothetical protein